MVRQPEITIDLQTVLKLDRQDDAPTISVDELLERLAQEFGETGGFESASGTRFITRTFKTSFGPYIGDTSISYSELYQHLAQVGYLRQEKRVSSGGKRTYFYRFNLTTFASDRTEAEQQEEVQRVPVSTNIPKDLLELTKAYKTLMGITVNLDEVVTDSLGKRLLGDRPFMEIMHALRQNSPQVYERMGGNYLDRLLLI